MKDLTVYFNGKPLYTLSKNLIISQNVSDENIEILKALHVQKLEIFEKMKNTDDPKELHEMAASVEKIEFNMQEAWGFVKNRMYHRWWEVPKCTCPKMDNQDNIGTKYRITDTECPVHGKL